MTLIYLIAIEITFILTLLFILPLYLAIIAGIGIIVTVFIFRKKKEKLLLIIPIIFLIRAAMTLDFTQFKKGDIITVATQIYRGRGKLDKINGKIPSTASYIQTHELEDGKYKISGEIKNLNTRYRNNYYEITPLEIEKTKGSFLEKYFNNKTRSLLKNSDFKLKKVYSAVILGQSYKLPKDMREEFSYIGISHLMALSGFHIGLVIAIATFIITKFPFSKKGRNISLLLFLTLYYLGIEHSPSLTRAYIMAGIYLLGNILYEDTDLMKSLTAAYVISLFINPMDITSLSFKLSYSAVFIIAGIYPIIRGFFNYKNKKFIDGIILIFTLQILLAPILINEFGTIQVLGFISNIIVVPVGSLFITLSFIGLLMENLHLGFIMMPVIKLSYYIFIKIVNLFSKIPYMSITISKGYHNNYFYFFYFGILIGIIYIHGKKEKTTNEKLFKRTEIRQ